ncbi:MAG TPA: NUDIX hydrolase [Herpetosiphonaceae bacterium]
MRHTSDHVAIDLIALAIIRDADKIVLVQQQHRADLPPYWVLPGGLVEAGELVTEALIREVAEEAGVHVDALSHLACLSHIDRPAQRAQSIAFIFEAERWHGELASCDPDAEVLGVELVPLTEGISRLQSNGGWSGIQTPVLAYLRGERAAGANWFYREDGDGQQWIACMPG